MKTRQYCIKIKLFLRKLGFCLSGFMILGILLKMPAQGMSDDGAPIDYIVDREKRYQHMIGFVNSQRISSVEEINPQGELWEIVFSKEGETKFKAYLTAGANPNLIDKNTTGGLSRSLLQLYARAGNAEMMKLLLDKGALVSYVNAMKRTVLHDACFEGKEEILALCLNDTKTSKEKEIRKEIVNWPDVNGYTALHVASDLGCAGCVEILLKHHAEVDQLARHQTTALHFACYQGHDKIIQLLLGYISNPLIRHENGLAAGDFYMLGGLAQEEKRNMEIAERLFKSSSLVHAQRMQMIEEDASLKLFMSTFQRKCSAIFVAYKALESGALQTTKGDCAISETINILGSVIPLPGTGLALELIAKGVQIYELHQEQRKKSFLTGMFNRIDEMEEAVEEGAYQLTHVYAHKIKELTPKGAYTLAMCAIGQFLDYMRGDVEMDASYTLTSYILKGVTAPRPSFLEKVLPATWLDKRIDTKDTTLKWTQKDVFAIADEKLDSALDAAKDIVPVMVELATNHVEQAFNIQNTIDIVDQIKEEKSWKDILCCCLSHVAQG